MSINLNNYEAFFLDYHEGKLAPRQVAELMSFLEEHPELKEMFYEFENISLTELDDIAHDIEFERKDLLKKEVMFTKDEVNDLLAGSVEGVLDEDQQQALEELLAADPKLQHDLDLFRKTIITADISEVFEGKEELKRSVLITNENYEEYLSSAVDNELNAIEQKELGRFFAADPAMQRELELFRKTKLVPDLSIVYENKEELKRRKRSGLVWWHIPAAAAGMILAAGLFFLLNKPADEGAAIVKHVPAENSSNAVIAPAEGIKKEASQASEAVAAVDVAPVKPRIGRKGIVAPPSHDTQENDVPMQDDLRDLQSPAVANNTVLPVDSINDKEYIAAHINEINERTDPEESGERFRPPVASGYNSLRDVAVGRLKTSLMKEEADVHAERTRISKWDVVAIALKGFRKVTGRTTEMEKVYDEEGEVIAYNISVGGFEFSRNK